MDDIQDVSARTVDRKVTTGGRVVRPLRPPPLAVGLKVRITNTLLQQTSQQQTRLGQRTDLAQLTA